MLYIFDCPTSTCGGGGGEEPRSEGYSDGDGGQEFYKSGKFGHPARVWTARIKTATVVG